MTGKIYCTHPLLATLMIVVVFFSFLFLLVLFFCLLHVSMVASLGGLFPFWCPAFGEIKYVVVVVFVSTDEQIELQPCRIGMPSNYNLCFY